jgi:hypothetical protein
MQHKEVDPELSLLWNSSFTANEGAELHEIASAPLFTRDAANISGQVFQRGLLGTVAAIHSERDGLAMPTDRRLYMNLNAPTSGLVCGVQVRTKRESKAHNELEFTGRWKITHCVVHP